MKVVITGGSGFIGTNLVQHCLDQGDDAISLDIRAPANPAHAGLWRSVDICETEKLGEALTAFNPEALIHLAARTDLRGTQPDDYRANTVGVGNVLRACNQLASLTRVIFASSRMVMRIGRVPTSEQDYDPPNSYGASKVTGERLVRAADLKSTWCIVRPTSIWGPWFDVPYRNFFDAVLNGRYLHPGHREILKSFGFVGNTVYQLRRLLETDANKLVGRTLYLADYRPLELSSWAQLIAERAGCKTPKSAPISVLKAVAAVGSGLQKLGYPEPPLTLFRLSNLLTNMVFDTAELEELVGPCPFTVDAGVGLTLSWLEGSPKAARQPSGR